MSLVLGIAVMGSCEVCGWENAKGAVVCCGCGERLVAGTVPASGGTFGEQLPKRLALLAVTYLVFTSVGVYIGAAFIEEPIPWSDVPDAIILAPIFNMIPIASGAADPIFPITLACWFLFPAAAIVYLVRGGREWLAIVAAVSLVMNLSTCIRVAVAMGV